MIAAETEAKVVDGVCVCVCVEALFDIFCSKGAEVLGARGCSHRLGRGQPRRPDVSQL